MDARSPSGTGLSSAAKPPAAAAATALPGGGVLQSPSKPVIHIATEAAAEEEDLRNVFDSVPFTPGNGVCTPTPTGGPNGGSRPPPWAAMPPPMSFPPVPPPGYGGLHRHPANQMGGIHGMMYGYDHPGMAMPFAFVPPLYFVPPPPPPPPPGRHRKEVEGTGGGQGKGKEGSALDVPSTAAPPRQPPPPPPLPASSAAVLPPGQARSRQDAPLLFASSRRSSRSASDSGGIPTPPEGVPADSPGGGPKPSAAPNGTPPVDSSASPPSEGSGHHDSRTQSPSAASKAPTSTPEAVEDDHTPLSEAMPSTPCPPAAAAAAIDSPILAVAEATNPLATTMNSGPPLPDCSAGREEADMRAVDVPITQPAPATATTAGHHAPVLEVEGGNRTPDRPETGARHAKRDSGRLEQQEAAAEAIAAPVIFDEEEFPALGSTSTSPPASATSTPAGKILLPDGSTKPTWDSPPRYPQLPTTPPSGGGALPAGSSTPPPANVGAKAPTVGPPTPAKYENLTVAGVEYSWPTVDIAGGRATTLPDNGNLAAPLNPEGSEPAAKSPWLKAIVSGAAELKKPPAPSPSPSSLLKEPPPMPKQLLSMTQNRASVNTLRLVLFWALIKQWGEGLGERGDLWPPHSAVCARLASVSSSSSDMSVCLSGSFPGVPGDACMAKGAIAALMVDARL
eukprot:CAMPEP_0117664800 /NCGR_PEP_ID=MMETSP0804-20121206/9434_1 /TAXON_ID=1074897 /ORGANISM="Tetraselmis astigmatica, Strain CCMP880" /LENGTH=677 /DNA_ID=CAMNT_0005472099 /DNA_START=1120 /DNA_END=3152 /DNA_ORIENTATION=+